MLEQEIKILKQVDHPHILRLEEIYETAQVSFAVVCIYHHVQGRSDTFRLWVMRCICASSKDDIFDH